MSENWKCWHPLDKSKIIGEYIIGPMEVNSEDLIIIMEGKKNRLKFTFDGIPWSFKMTNESHRLQTFSDVSDRQGKDFLARFNFFEIDKSEYIRWIIKQSCGMYDDIKLHHFVLMDQEWVIDVVDEFYPKVEIVKLDS